VPLLKSSLPAAATPLELTDTTNGEAVRIDKAQLGEVIVNLCANANDALAGRGGRISLSVGVADLDGLVFRLLHAGSQTSSQRYSIMRRLQDADRILIGHVDPAAPYVHLSVKDNGCGIDSSVLSRIFDPYFTTKALGKGSGLGLSVVHGVVLGARGALALGTRPGEGTTVDVFLPVVEPVEADEAARFPAPRDIAGAVLVVDDEEEVRDMMSLVLERRGMSVLSCSDGAEALAAFEADPTLWDVVVTDYYMPELRGDELIRRVKALAPDVPCVLCTGFGEVVTDKDVREGSVDAFLLKPMEPALLQKTVAQLVSIRRANTGA
jgi:CheY-like chemotaxis protein